MKTQFPIVGDFGKERSSILGAESTINLYEVDLPVPHWPDVTKKTGLKKWPGLKQVVSFASGDNGRASFVDKVDEDVMYQVIEDKVYTLNSSLTPTNIATLTSSTGHVGIDQNQTQVIFVDGSKGYIWDRVSTWTEITDADFPSNPIDVVTLDGYFIVPKGGTNQFYLSNLNDGLTWTSGDYAAIESRPDVVVGCTTHERKLFIFGKQSTEVWQDAGLSDFPFRRINSILPPYGCAARDSIAEGFGFLFFLSQDSDGVGSIIMVKGINFLPVSTPSIEYQIEQITDVTDANGFIYKIDGNIFYQINFSTGDKTYVYHINKNKWYELKDKSGNRHIAQSHTYFQNKHYVNAHNDGKLYEMSNNYYDYNGSSMKCERITRAMSHPSDSRIRLNEIKLDCLQGVGTESGQDINPEILLSISRDEGQTFDYKMTEALGKIGERKYETYWYNLGQSRSFVFKFEYYPKTDFIITGMSIDYNIEEN